MFSGHQLLNKLEPDGNKFYFHVLQGCKRLIALHEHTWNYFKLKELTVRLLTRSSQQRSKRRVLSKCFNASFPILSARLSSGISSVVFIVGLNLASTSAYINLRIFCQQKLISQVLFILLLANLISNCITPYISPRSL